MRAALLLLLVCPSLFASSRYDLEVTTAKLDNGLTILVSRDPAVSDVAVELWFRAGSADEAPGQYGLAHLFEHMLPGATRVLAVNRPLFDRDRLDSNGATATEYTRFVGRYPATSLEVPIAVFADRMAASPDAITEADLAKHKQTVLAEFRNGAGRTWDAAVLEPVRRALFGAGHPYGHSTMGSTLDVEAATLDGMRRWFRRYYGAANAMLVVVGNADPARVVELARKHFGSIPPGSAYAATATAVAPLPERRFFDVSAPEATPALDLYWRTPRWGDPARQDLAIAKELLRERLQQELGCEARDVEELEAAAGGMMSLRVRCGDAMRALAILDGFLTSAPSIDAAREARLAIYGDALGRLGWRPSRAQLLGEGLWLAGDARTYLRHIERVSSVTPQQVMATAREWLRHPLVVRIAPASTTAEVDRGAPLDVPVPSIAVPADVEDGMIGGVRLLSARRAAPIAIAHLVPRDGAVLSVTATPAAFDRELRALLKRAAGAFDLVVVGDIERERVSARLRELPPMPPAAAVADPPPFTPKAGAPQTTLTAVLTFAPDASVARVALAADLLRARLNERLREQERWVYSVGARFERRGGAPAIVIEIPVRDDLAVRAMETTKTYIAALATEALTAAEVPQVRAAELRRLAALASAPSDLAQALVNILRTGEPYEDYTRTHQALFESAAEGQSLDLPVPARIRWTATGDPARVDPLLSGRTP
ncbi:MAG TPA: pitrilysin family protein [Thermoanaerobaculia bacterium]